MSRIHIGIDPGKTGAICYKIGDCPYLVKTFEDYRRVATSYSWEPDNTIIYMELVHSMPGQGVKSVFTFGENNGWWKGHLETLGLKYTLVTPQKWKKAIETYSGIPNNKSKQWSVQVVNKLMPAMDIGKNHNKADAILITLYAKIMEE